MAGERIVLEGGKYTVVNNHGAIKVLRHGEEWRDCTGDKLIGAMFNEIQELKEQLRGGAPLGLPVKKNLDTAPKCLNTGDAAMWVTGWNECVDAIKVTP